MITTITLYLWTIAERGEKKKQGNDEVIEMYLFLFCFITSVLVDIGIIVNLFSY